MCNTSIAIPSVRLRQILRFVKLYEAVLYAHVFRPIFLLVFAFEVRVLVLDEPIQTAVERPAPSSIELYGDFELITDGKLKVLLVGATTALGLLTSDLFLLFDYFFCL